MKLPSNIAFACLFLCIPWTWTAEAQASPEALGDKPKFRVVLDAGHGGKDPGNTGNGYLEKNIALAIVLKAGKILEARPEIEVIYTRDSDTFIELFERGEIANKANADLFVSVHCDSHSSDAYGAGTFVLGLHANKQNYEVAKKENSVIYLEEDYQARYAQYDINSPVSVIGLTVLQEEFLEQSIEIARLIQKNFSTKLSRKDRKVKQAGFIVLHQTFMPSVLVETGFLTNKKEGAYLNSKKGQDEMSRAIADAIIEYKQGIVVTVDPLEVAASTETPEAAVPNTKTEVTGSKRETPATDLGVVFKVQIMASKIPMKMVPSQFNGLDEISTEKFGEYNRYMYGSTGSYKEARELQRVAQASGYSEAYIVVYENGKRVRLTEGIRKANP